MRAGIASRTVLALAVASRLAFPAPATPGVSTTPRLPAPIIIDTGKVRIEIARDGHARKIGPRVVPFPRDAAWRPDTGVWFAIRRHHLVVGRWHRTLWRSHGRYRTAGNIGVVTIGDHVVAFSYRTAGAEELYLAPLTGRERRVARNEFPLGWTAGGFYAYRYPGRELLLRSDTGALEATVVRNPSSYAYDNVTRSLYFIARGSVVRSEGSMTQPLASLGRLGLPARRPNAGLIPLGRLIEVLSNQRLILLRPDGSLFAGIRLPYPDGALAGDVTIAGGGRAVAFASAPPTPSGATTATDTVYVLRAGARKPTAVHTERIDLTGCDQWAGVQWNGPWLLYAASDGHVAVIDSTRRRAAIELTATVRRLIGTAQDGFDAYWGGAPRGR